jgi:hypothetical protein
MGHPNKALPETRGTRIQYTVHPQADKGAIKPKKANRRRWTDSDERYYQRLISIVELWLLSQLPPNEQPYSKRMVTQLAGIPDNVEKKIEKLSSRDMLRLLESIGKQL